MKRTIHDDGMRPYAIASAILHGAGIALLILGLPPGKEPLDLPSSIPIEIVGPDTGPVKVDQGKPNAAPPKTTDNKPDADAVSAPPPPLPEARREPTPQPTIKPPEPPAPTQQVADAREPTPPPEPVKPPEPKPVPPKPPEPKPDVIPPPEPKPEPQPEPQPVKPPEPKPEPPKPPEPKPEPPKPEPPKPEPVKPEPPKAPDKKPEPAKPPENKPETASKPDAKPTPKADPLSSLLATADSYKKDLPKNATPGKSGQVADKPSASTEKPGAVRAMEGADKAFMPSGRSLQAVTAAIGKNWNVDSGRRDAANLKVRVVIELAPDFTVKNVGLDPENLARYKSDPAFRAAAEAAFRAVRRASPLPLDRAEFAQATYDKWHFISVDFDPSEML